MGFWQRALMLIGAVLIALSLGAPAHAQLQKPPTATPKASSDGTPMWLWVVLGGGGLVVFALVLLFLQKGKGGDDGTSSKSKSSSKASGKAKPASPSLSASARMGDGGGGDGGKKSKDADEDDAGGNDIPEMLGSYRLLNLMMTGQTSQVWEATEGSSGRHFAVKILLPEYANKREHREFLFHEADVGIELAHPNIIKIVTVVKDKQPHFVMDFFPGGSLKMRILHKETDWIKEKAHDILKQAATGFAFMNAKGWVHRDIKPDNILVNSAGEVRIIDFAIAHKIRTGFLGKLLSRKGPVQGTRSYMSPEQIRNEPLDGRADIYSFGATCFELVTGRPPFRGATNQDLLHKHMVEKPVTPVQFNPEVTTEFGELVLKMLAKKKEQRPANFHEVLIELRKIRVFKTPAEIAKMGQKK